MEASTKHSKYGLRVKVILVLLLISTSLFAVSGQMIKHVSFNIQSYSYASYSEQRSHFPLIAGNPRIISSILALGGKFHVGRHEFSVDLFYPGTLSADDGIGNNYLLNELSSIYFRSHIDYAFFMPLFSQGCVHAHHALHVGILYEDRVLTYLNGSNESTKDINMYLGPRIKLGVDLKQNWSIHLNFDARFYLPYLNYGTLTSTSSSGLLMYATEYYAFYYQTLLGIKISKKINDNNEIHVGICKNDLVGFANSKPLFYMDDMVHFKFDRLMNVYLEYDMILGKKKR
jgi:hypothetical protein